MTKYIYFCFSLDDDDDVQNMNTSTYYFRVIQLFVFLQLILPSDQIPCSLIKHKTSEFNIKTLNTLIFEDLMENLESTDEYMAACQVKLTVNYMEYSLIVLFTPISTLNDRHTIDQPKLTTIFTFDQKKPSIVGELIYTCRRIANCDRHFVLNHYLLLVNRNYTDLYRNFDELLSKDKEIDTGLSCFTDSDELYVKRCTNQACNGQFYMDSLDEFYVKAFTSDCASAKIKSTSIKITTEPNLKDYSFKQSIQYTCMNNLCNNQLTTNSLSSFIQNSSQIFNITYRFTLQKSNISTTRKRTTTTIDKVITSSSLSFTTKSLQLTNTSVVTTSDRFITETITNTATSNFYKLTSSMTVIFLYLK